MTKLNIFKWLKIAGCVVAIILCRYCINKTDEWFPQEQQEQDTINTLCVTDTTWHYVSLDEGWRDSVIMTIVDSNNVIQEQFIVYIK